MIIPGLKYIPNFITEKEENNLLHCINNEEWCLDLRRRTQHYGYKYSYSQKEIDVNASINIPNFFFPFLEKVVPFFEEKPNQIIVNEYLPGQGIGFHIDRPKSFGPTIASLSLGEAVKMQFKEVDNSSEEISLNLEPRSLLVLTDDARYKYAHGIVKQENNKRISITFRTIIKS